MNFAAALSIFIVMTIQPACATSARAEESPPLPEWMQKELEAKELRLTKGRQYAACRDMLAKLNLLPNPAYGRGEFPIDPRFPLLSKPDWQTVDMNEHRDIVRRFTAFNIVKDVETINGQYDPLPYNDSDSLITIGYGFNLEDVRPFMTPTVFGWEVQPVTLADIQVQPGCLVIPAASALCKRSFK